jgi:hypothetical protein
MQFGGSVAVGILGRLEVNHRSNPVSGNITILENLIAKRDAEYAPVCVLAFCRSPDLPLYFSWTGQMSRHWPSFAINESYQFDPETLAWCERNLSCEGGWQAFDAPPWYRVYFRPATGRPTVSCEAAP